MPSTCGRTCWPRGGCCPAGCRRGEGYFVATASAAGLLTQIGSAPYAVTKHAAVAFAEWLSVTYGERGVRVSCLCPMGVRTAMLAGDELGQQVVRAAGAVLEPEEVADAVIAAIDAEQFLILPHPEVLTFFQRKAMDYERWLAGMRRVAGAESRRQRRRSGRRDGLSRSGSRGGVEGGAPGERATLAVALPAARARKCTRSVLLRRAANRWPRIGAARFSHVAELGTARAAVTTVI